MENCSKVDYWSWRKINILHILHIILDLALGAWFILCYRTI